MIIALEEAKYKLIALEDDMKELKSALRVDELKEKIAELEAVAMEENFWSDQARSSKILKETKQMKDTVEEYEALVSKLEDALILCEMAIEEDDEGAVPLGRVFLNEDTEKTPLKTAVEYAASLTATFADHVVGCLHGRMKPAEKDAVMRRFAEGGIDILVSTTVIEVGVNVPNASLMVIENAERFGLSQLHQLRGRVGRGLRKSYCILISDARGETATRRLRALCSTYDGYAIAEEDLRLRGPGDFFASADDSIRQSGGLKFSPIASAASHEVISSAFSEAAAILKADPELSMPENRALAEEVHRLFRVQENTFS